MRMELYVVFDRVAGRSGDVLEAVNVGVALRQFQRVQLKSEFPKDYRLLRVGFIDHETSIITALAIPEDVTEDIAEATLNLEEVSNG